MMDPKSEQGIFSLEIIRDYLKPGTTFVDIGTHPGNYSFLAPNQESVKIIAIDVSNVTPTLFMDAVLSGKADFVRISAEGHEVDFLSGLTKTIKRNENIVMLVEFDPKLQRDAGHKEGDLFEKLEDAGFECFLVDERERKLYRHRSNIFPLRMLMSGRGHVNVLCLNKKRSLSVVCLSHRASLAGAERCLLDIIEGLNKKGAVMHVILPKHGVFIDKIRRKTISYKVIRFAWWAFSDRFKLIMGNIVYFYSNFGLLYEIARVNPHVVYTNTMVVPGGAFAAFFLNKPHVWYIHEFGEKDHGFKFIFTLKGTLRMIDLLSDKVIYNSMAVKEEFSGFIDEAKSEVIYNSIEVPEASVKENADKVYKYKDSLKLILAGKVSEGKGQDQAVMAISGLIKDGYDVELLILGSFSERDRYFSCLRRRAEEEGKGRIYFRNFVDNPYPYMAQADVLLMCSRCEAFGRATVEAMRLKKPVIGVRAGGTVELVKNGYDGLLYTSGDINDLKEKIKYFVMNKDQVRIMGENGYNFSTGNFNEEQLVGPIFRSFMEIKDIKRSLRDQMGKLVSFVKILFDIVCGRSLKK